MKKISVLLVFILAFFFSKAQYPVNQSLGSDSALVTSKGGLKGRIVVWNFVDTTAANLQRIKDYAGALVFAGNALWFRDSTITKWVQILPSGGIGGQSAWLLNGNDRSLYPDSASLGTTSANPFYIITSNFKRIGFHQDGIQDSTADVLALGIDTATGFLAYARAGGGGGGGGGSNTPIGAGFKIAVGVNATNIKSLRGGYGVIVDSATTGEIKHTLDSATVYGVVRQTVSDSLVTVYFRNPASGDTILTNPSTNVYKWKSHVVGYGLLSANVTDTTFGSKVDTTLIATIFDLTGYVTLTTAQTITGKKTFSDTTFVNGGIGVNSGNDFKVIAAAAQFVKISNANRSIAIGEATVANGYAALAAGTGASASGTGSLALGNTPLASGLDATALGSHAIASGQIASALGPYTIAPSFGEAVVGYNNTPYTPSSTTDTVGTDRLFTIGNGGSTANPSDALIMLKNGKTKVYNVWQYAGNYAANFNDSSFTNKKYVDSVVSASGGVTPSGADYNLQMKLGASLYGSDTLNWDAPNAALTVKGSFKGDPATGDVVVLDGAGNRAFRGTNANNWLTPTATQFFQIGTFNSPVAFTAQGGTTMAQSQFASSKFQITAGTYNLAALPTKNFELVNSVDLLKFSIDDSGSVVAKGRLQTDSTIHTLGITQVPVFDSTNYKIDVVDAAGKHFKSYWPTVTALTATNFVYNEEFTGSTSSTYTLANTPITGKLVVFKNGVKLPNSEFSLSGAIVTLTSARVSGDILSNDYIK